MAGRLPEVSVNDEALKAAARPGWEWGPGHPWRHHNAIHWGGIGLWAGSDGTGYIFAGDLAPTGPTPVDAADLRELAAQFVAVAEAMEPDPEIDYDMPAALVRGPHVRIVRADDWYADLYPDEAERLARALLVAASEARRAKS